jgi:cell wall-associated NlpC family hydrolase
MAAGGLFLLLTACATLPPRLRLNPDQTQQVLTLAKSFLGTVYRYGGRTPAGFDCSGFVQYVYRHTLHVSLPRSSQQQFSATLPVPVGQERPADLLFFSVQGWGPSHVGIYLGHGQMIHASGEGDVVKISDANSNYWRSRFLGVRRVLP